MLFNSFAFAVFFPTVLILYWFLPHRYQNYMLLAASYVFYGWWDWRFLSLILLSTVIDYIIGLRLQGATLAAGPQVERQRKQLVAISVAANLGILGFFKYFDFFAESFAVLLRGFGIEAHPFVLGIVLPVGISFYTFQTMSYTIEIYRGEMVPTRKFPEFALFVAFFPQLVAGPIERAKVFLPQILQRRKVDRVQIVDGMHLIFWGLFKKVYVADNLAPYVETLFSLSNPTGWETLMAAYGFAFQIYCDFSGYSDIARGCAKMLGFELMINFAYPYTSKNPGEFWQRWHISLSTWLRDYLYIPLGGNRKGNLMTYRNLALTMLLGGLWHGATWLFVLWGGYQGTLLIVHRLLKTPLSRIRFLQDDRPGSLSTMVKVFVMFQFVCVGWLIFRGQSTAQIADMTWSIITLQGPIDLSLLAPLLAFVTPLLIIDTLQYVFKREDLYRLPVTLSFKSAVYAGLSYLLVFQGAAAQSFIYFQF